MLYAYYTLSISETFAFDNLKFRIFVILGKYTKFFEIRELHLVYRNRGMCLLTRQIFRIFNISFITFKKMQNIQLLIHFVTFPLFPLHYAT